ncbi:MAG: zinc ABC transporter substrate-binding protein [Anaerolineae bacterium]|nr:zinc ABC transporter substrate-binding protein [Anaerolineae bacterium]
MIVSTTTIVGDIVQTIGGDHITLTVLLPPGMDPHKFEPNPQEMASLVDADLIFANGAGLEEFLEPLIVSNQLEDEVINVSDGIEYLVGVHGTENDEHEGEYTDDAEGDGEEDHDHGQIDPHTWTDPNNVLVWVDNITAALSSADPGHALDFQANAEAYKTLLKDLDQWVREQVATIPQENREIVTDHQLFGYYADAYGFIQVGAIIPAFSTSAEASASEIAALEDAILKLNARAIFIGNTINPQLAERISQDTGVQLYTVYTGSLSDPGGEAPTYLEYIRYNTNVFVTALQ